MRGECTERPTPSNLESSQRGWDSEAIEKDGQSDRKGQIFVEREAKCGWKKTISQRKDKRHIESGHTSWSEQTLQNVYHHSLGHTLGSAN